MSHSALLHYQAMAMAAEATAANPLHPTMRAAIGIMLDSAATLRRAEYIGRLKSHDWSHEYSDDARKYRLGREQLAELRRIQAAIDPDHALWNKIAPAEYRAGK